MDLQVDGDSQKVINQRWAFFENPSMLCNLNTIETPYFEMSTLYKVECRMHAQHKYLTSICAVGDMSQDQEQKSINLRKLPKLN